MTPYLLVLGAILLFFVMLRAPKAWSGGYCDRDDGRDSDGGGDAS